MARVWAWHGGVTAALIVGALTAGDDAVFMGDAWGIRLPLALLIVPFAVSTHGHCCHYFAMDTTD